MKKKWMLILGITVLMCSFFLAVVPSGEKMPVPDAIILYQNGDQQALKPEDAVFSNVYALIRVDTDSVQETAIDPDTVQEIKETLAVEFRYEAAQQIGGRGCSRVLISLSGWTEGCAVLYRDGQYCSGTYACSVSPRKLMEVIN